ncbi:MAG TPA: aminoglycoside adenylyltransferase domain-containing protein, partial [Nocardioidaceae bacterium]|nr:aminoglycoside adenylyltransferase domain-containing protein [Nocardioidaceae bacterium]
MHPARRSASAPGWPPPAVQQVADTFLSLVDDVAPGLVEGLYLHGSVGFGEWYDARSDIDYVAVLGQRPDAATVEVLRHVHGRVCETFPRPPFDGFHLTWDDLARPPYDCPDLPCTQAGYFHDEERLDVHPVTWHELAHHGIALRGPAPESVAIWTDQQVLRGYTHDNLRDYWQPAVEALRKFPEEAAKPEQVTWFVLGTARLHHLLATDRLTSKTGAGRYALEAFDPRWRPIIAEAIVFRELDESTGAFDGRPARRAQDTLDFVDMVVRTG